MPGHGVVPLPPEWVGSRTGLPGRRTPPMLGSGGVRVRLIHEPVAESVGDHLSPVLHVQFVEDVTQVVLDRVLADEEALRKLLVGGNPLYQGLEPFALPRRQYVGGLRRWAGFGM